MTANEAWELMKELPKMNRDDLEEVYGTRDPWNVLVKYSPEEAQKKLDDWKSRKEIQIGDEVEFYDTEHDFYRAMYVTSRFTDEDYCGICTNGDTYCIHKSNLTKTGRHIDFDKIKDLIAVDGEKRQERPVTNGDKIRKMNNDDLATILGVILENMDTCSGCPIDAGGFECNGASCEFRIRDWLDETAREE